MTVVEAQARMNLQERNLLPTASVLGAFIVFGFLFGVWQVLLTDLSASLGLSSGGLGFALTAGLTASIPAMMVGGRVGDRFGQRVIIVGAALVMGSVFLGLAFVRSYALLVALLVAFFAASGIYDVGINAGAMTLEQANGRKVIGGVAEVAGLRAALAVVIVAGMMIFFLSLYIPSRELLGRSSIGG